ncbi:MAG TPA: MarR family transcriptional regulator [Casimicrobiaceae bacterium]
MRSKSREAAERLPASDPVEALGLLVAGVAKSWREELDRRLHPLGLTRVQWQALLWLDRAGGELVQGELAERLDIGAPATVALVDRMQRDGLVVRREVARDRRLKAVVATARARALQERIRRTALTLRREVRATLTDAELETLCALLARVRGGFEALRR